MNVIFYNSLAIVLLPLLAAIITGLAGPYLGKRGAHTLTIAAVATAFGLSVYVLKLIFIDQLPSYNGVWYNWATSGNFQFNIGFLIDRLSAIMMTIVTFVSLMVHIYSIGYMQDDPSYQRFFSYISLFTFAMLMLVTANNFLQLFFGWEGVGLVSYLLIGFWFKKESANLGSLKAFIVNRVGDLGFILGIAAILDYFGSVDFNAVFVQAPQLVHTTISILPGSSWSIITVICLLLFIGAMGKSAQVPLHVWLPESMEGPTPISALIHAATMVTAGIYLVARMSPLFEYSETALSVVLVIGATGALFTGILALVQNDIKRVIAYSTLSQLGYMMAAQGASAYAAGIFHLLTHACFKALLFLAAGSVILAMHHEQDLRKMGNLRRYMPITYVTFLIGALALCAIPPFAGFYSKDAIIDAVYHCQIAGAHYAFYCLAGAVLVTSLYTFRAFFMAFHGPAKFATDPHHQPHESPAVVWWPLVILAVPSLVLGALLAAPALYLHPNLLGDSIFVLPQHDTLASLAASYQGPLQLLFRALENPCTWLAVSGIVLAWLAYIRWPTLPQQVANRCSWLYRILINKYGFDAFNEKFIVRGSYGLGQWLFNTADIKVIDQAFVDGSGRMINWLSRLTRQLQSGYIYHYAFIMLLGLLGLLGWLLFG